MNDQTYHDLRLTMEFTCLGEPEPGHRVDDFLRVVLRDEARGEEIEFRESEWTRHKDGTPICSVSIAPERAEALANAIRRDVEDVLRKHMGHPMPPIPRHHPLDRTEA